MLQEESCRRGRGRVRNHVDWGGTVVVSEKDCKLGGGIETDYDSSSLDPPLPRHSFLDLE